MAERAKTMAAGRCQVRMPARDVRLRQFRIQAARWRSGRWRHPRSLSAKRVHRERGWETATSSKLCPGFVIRTNAARENQNPRASGEFHFWDSPARLRQPVSKRSLIVQIRIADQHRVATWRLAELVWR